MDYFFLVLKKKKKEIYISPTDWESNYIMNIFMRNEHHSTFDVEPAALYLHVGICIRIAETNVLNRSTR